ncbi:MAG TPA: FtsX-like permease family protein, partial [Actinomycetota bacterium]|nr:FtsX-like permease family protein [Actinomycetota bacterium]
AEPHPGFAFDATALLIGVAAVLVVVVGVSGFAGWRLARAAGSSLGTAEVANARPSMAAGALARASMPPTAVAGVRLALEPGHGRTALPVRTTLISVAVGIAALIATLTFSSSLHHLLATPALYGVGWDTEVDAPNFGSNDVLAKYAPAVERIPGVEGIAAGGADISVTLNKVKGASSSGVVANGLAFEEIYGRHLIPPAIEGRLPDAPGEIALGSKTLERLHSHIGDTVYADIGNGFAVLPFRIVGVAVVPPFSAQGSLGQGSVISSKEAAAVPGAPPANVMWVRFSSPAARRAGWSAIKERFPDAAVYATPTPNDILDFGRVRSLPFVLAGVLALLSAATLAHAIVTAIRRRRRDLAILKTLGFVRAQVRRSVAWQASALAIVAMIVAVPIGVAVGRALWNLLATQLGIRAVSVTPLPSVLLTVPATLVLAVGISALPARAAARTKPALVLRAE